MNFVKNDVGKVFEILVLFQVFQNHSRCTEQNRSELPWKLRRQTNVISNWVALTIFTAFMCNTFWYWCCWKSSKIQDRMIFIETVHASNLLSPLIRRGWEQMIRQRLARFLLICESRINWTVCVVFPRVEIWNSISHACFYWTNQIQCHQPE